MRLGAAVVRGHAVRAAARASSAVHGGGGERCGAALEAQHALTLRRNELVLLHQRRRLLRKLFLEALQLDERRRVRAAL